MKKIISIHILILFSLFVNAQHSSPETINAKIILNNFKFDGNLNDKIWNEAKHISNFTQRDLNFGKPVSEKTEVALIYSKEAMYIGIWCYQNPKSIIARNMSIDADLRRDDNFMIVISPFGDNRGGYFFAINPNGARTDILIAGNEDGNADWNGVWDVKTSITSEGWFAEVEIPFSTLQFKRNNNYNWSINFQRSIVSKQEEALWQGWTRDNTIFAVVNAGKIEGLQNINYAKRFEFKPYALIGYQFNKNDKNEFPLKFGGNLNVNLTPSLKLNLTSYTDFAQVESDRIPVNLSRFSVYYPEKRAFFLEGYDQFNFYLGDRNSVFYTRTLGTEIGQTVPIIGAVRLFGKIGKSNIGFLNLQENKIDTISGTNNTVIRYKYDIGEQSYIGGIFTNKINNTESNQVLGLDAAYQTSKFLKNKNLSISASIAISGEDFKASNNATTYRISTDYPNDLIDNYMGISTMQNGFNPELGYLRRSNYRSYNWYFRITPRVFTNYGVKKLILKPWGTTIYQTLSTGELESLSNETRPIGAEFKSGEQFEFNLIQLYDRLDSNFELTDEVSIPKGKYWMYRNEFQFETNQSRKIWASLLYNWGDFYTGKIKTFESEIGLNVNKHFNINTNYTLNVVSLPNNELFTNEITTYFNYAFTTKLNISFFGQWNSLDDVLLFNFRLHWLPKIGSDIYLVYNTNYDEPIKQVEILKPQTSTGIFKIIWRFVF